MVNSEPERSDLQTIATLLQDEGYRARVEPERNTIYSAASGFKTSLYLTNGSIQMRCGLIGKDSPVQLQHVNEFNATYRFAKMYLDDEGDIILEYDFLFDAHKDDAAASLREVLALFEQSIGALKDLLRTVQKEAKAVLAAGEPESSTVTLGLPSGNT